MARSSAFYESDQFYCYPLGASTAQDRLDIMAFRPAHSKGAGLALYLQHSATSDEVAGTMRTYLVRDKDTDELAGYFSLKAGLATHNEEQEGQRIEFDTIPGVELANFAVNGAYLERHAVAKGCGEAIYRELIREVVRQASEIVGVAIIYLCALPDARVIENYERYGFRRLAQSREDKIHSRLKPRYDQKCIFMYTAA